MGAREALRLAELVDSMPGEGCGPRPRPPAHLLGREVSSVGWVGSRAPSKNGARLRWGTAWGVYLASLDPEAQAPTLAGQQEGTERTLALGDPGAGGSGTKPWGRGRSGRTWSKVLVAAEAGPSPWPLPSSLRHPWGRFPETGSGPPNQLGTVSAPAGQVRRGTHRWQVCRGCRPPIQCEGFLCSVVFLNPPRGQVPGGSRGSGRGRPGSCSSVCGGSLGWRERGERPSTHGRASGIHGAWAPMSLVCALQS